MVTLDLRQATVTVDGVTTRPPRRVWLLIRYLAAHPEWVREIGQIADAIEAPMIGADGLRTAVKRARRIVGADRIGTHYGMGYFWRGPAQITGGEE